jgi:hypothetical protein
MGEELGWEITKLQQFGLEAMGKRRGGATNRNMIYYEDKKLKEGYYQ